MKIDEAGNDECYVLQVQQQVRHVCKYKDMRSTSVHDFLDCFTPPHALNTPSRLAAAKLQGLNTAAAWAPALLSEQRPAFLIAQQHPGVTPRLFHSVVATRCDRLFGIPPLVPVSLLAIFGTPQVA